LGLARIAVTYERDVANVLAFINLHRGRLRILGLSLGLRGRSQSKPAS
jgi:hypothetical protein